MTSARSLGRLAATLVLTSLPAMTWAAKPPSPTPTPTAPPGAATPIQIFGAWHCGNHFCDWSQVRDTSVGGEFDIANRWLVDRGDGRPSVNMVSLSFVQPEALFNNTTDAGFVNGLPRGMTPAVVSYFKSRGITVILSVGGITYTDEWDRVLVIDGARLGTLVRQAVTTLGADGAEIDWENGTPSAAEMAGLEAFIDAYRAAGPRNLLTMDLAAGSRFLQELSRRAAASWLPSREIDYINAMVPRGEPTTDQWQEHIDGKPNYGPPIGPKAPANVAVSLWLTNSNQPQANCVNFPASSMLAKSGYVQSVAPNGAGTTRGMLGYMFWAAECPSTRNICTTPPNSCEGGMGAGATHFNIPIPMGTLRED
jgi:hypothetical protein